MFCLDATFGNQGTSVGPGQYPRYSDARKGRPWVAHYDSTTRLKHLHGSGAGSLRPQIYEVTTELDDKVRLRVFRRSRNVQEPTGSPTGSPQEIQKEIP